MWWHIPKCRVTKCGSSAADWWAAAMSQLSGQWGQLAVPPQQPDSLKPFPLVSQSLRSCRTAGSPWAWQPTFSYYLTLQKSSASVSVMSVCMWQFIFSQSQPFFMLALVCAVYLGQLAKCTRMCVGVAFEFSTISSESMANNSEWVICLMKLLIFCSQMVHE